jgi:putative membrane protein
MGLGGSLTFSSLQLWAVGAMLVCTAAAGAGTRDQKVNAAAFLAQAAQAHEAEIALGELAMEQAADERIKQFGRRMVEDHREAKRELEDLSEKTGSPWPTELNEAQERHQRALQNMSGREFDRSYIAVMVQEHSKAVKQFERAALGADNQDVRHWAAGSLPMLNEHHHEARALSASMGLKRTQAR